MEKKICNICIESSHKFVVCYCGFSACTVCYSQYILSKNEYAQCMSEKCHKIWSKEFMFDNFTQTFINNEYKKHKECFLADKELGYLPIAQKELERIKNIKRFKKLLNNFITFKKNNETEYDNICSKLTNLAILESYCYSIYYDNIKTAIHQLEIKSNKSFIEIVDEYLKRIIDFIEFQQVDSEFINVIKDINNVNNDIKYNYKSNIHKTIYDIIKNNQYLLENNKVVVEKKFTRQCPSNNCRGYLSTNLFCELCEITACSKCREVKEKKHECDPQILLNIKFLEKDSKNCPTCSSIIFRISGCNQMYCTQCKTAFDWKTLKIETGVIHNPHFFQYNQQRVVQEEYDDNACCRELNNDFSRKFNNVFKDYRVLRDKLQEILHIRQVILPSFVPPVAQVELLNQDLHLKYLENYISLDKFKTLCQQRNKKHEKNLELYNLVYMYIQSMSDIFFNLYDSCNVKFTVDTTDSEIKDLQDNILKYYNEYKNLDQYLNKHYKKIREIFNSKPKLDYILYNIDYTYPPIDTLFIWKFTRDRDILFKQEIDRKKQEIDRKKLEIKVNKINNIQDEWDKLFYCDTCKCCLCKIERFSITRYITYNIKTDSKVVKEELLNNEINCKHCRLTARHFIENFNEIDWNIYVHECYRSDMLKKYSNRIKKYEQEKESKWNTIQHDCDNCDLVLKCCFCKDTRSESTTNYYNYKDGRKISKSYRSENYCQKCRDKDLNNNFNISSSSSSSSSR